MRFRLSYCFPCKGGTILSVSSSSSSAASLLSRYIKNNYIQSSSPSSYRQHSIGRSIATHAATITTNTNTNTNTSITNNGTNTTTNKANSIDMTDRSIDDTIYKHIKSNSIDKAVSYYQHHSDRIKLLDTKRITSIMNNIMMGYAR